MRVIIVFIGCFFSLITFSQTWKWVDRVSGPGNNYVFTVKFDDYDSSIYSTGRVKSAGNFGEISVPTGSIDYGDRDVFLTKHDIDGNLIWVKRFGGLYTDYGVGIEVNEDFIFSIGFFTDTLIIDLTDTLISNGEQDIFIAKFDKGGNLVSTTTFGGYGNDQVDAAELDSNGNLLIVGAFEDSIAFEGIMLVNTINSTLYPTTKSAFVLKLDEDFNVIWAKKQQSTRDVVHTDIIERDGFAYITGYYNGICEFYPGVNLIMNSSFWQSSLMKITEDGNFVWVKGFGGNYSDILASIDIDMNNNIYVGGMYRGTAAYQTEIFTSPNHYLNNGMIVKLDTSGSVLSSFAFPSSTDGKIECIKVLENKVYAGGYFSDSLFLDNDTLFSTGLYDMAIYCLDTGLNLNWSSFQGGSSYDQIRSIDVFSDHTILFGGNIRNTITFPTVTFTTLVNTYDGVMGIVSPPAEARIKNLDTTYCTNSTVTLYNNSIGSFDNVLWDIGGLSVLFSDNDSIMFTSSSLGVYQVELTVSSLSEADSIMSNNIYFYENASVDLGVDTLNFCAGENVLIQGTGIYDEILWNTTEMTSEILANTQGWYYATVSLAGQCFDVDSVFLQELNCLNIPENSGSLVQVFHNGRLINIIDFDVQVNSQYQVFDLGFRLIGNGEIENGQITFSNQMARGCYIIVLDGVLTSKFVILE